MPGLKTPLSLSFCLFALFSHELVSQVDSSTEHVIEHAAVIDNRVNEPIRMFSMRLPFSVSPIKGNGEFALHYGLGNAWNPSGVLEYPEVHEPYPEKPWQADYHPPYYEVPSRYQLYSADGVFRSSMIGYTRKVSPVSEVYANVTGAMLVSGKNFADLPVADRTIEFLHRLIFDMHDPFRRHLNGFDLVEMELTDRQGRTFRMKPGKAYLSTVDIGYRHFVTLRQTNKLLWTLNVTAQVGAPFNSARDHLSAGMITSTAVTTQISKKYSLTVAGGLTAQHDKLLRLRPEQYAFHYAEVVTGYRFMVGQNFDRKKGRRFTIGIEMQGMTSPLSTKKRVTAPYINPEDIGIQTNYKPEYWTAQQQINVTNQRRAARGLIRGSENISLNFSYRFGDSGNAPTVAIYLQEDWTVVYDVEGPKPVPLFLEFNNAQDFGMGIKLTKPLR